MLAVLDVDNSIEKQIKILRDANQRLISTQVEKQISLGKESTRFDKMRTKLSAAASVLGPNLGFDCLCHQKHAAFLKIPEWSRPQGQVVDEEFSLLFHNENDVCAWKCIEMSSNVKKVEEIHERGQDTTHDGGTGRQVRFAGDEFELEEDTDFITINAQAESARHLAVEATTGGISSPQHIELARPPSLCEYMASIQKEDNESGKFNVVMNTPSLSLRMTPIAALGRPVTLIPLELHFSERGGRPLTTLERLKLSTQVASAVLCLYHTTWLPEFWSYADIYLRHDGDGLKFNPWIVNSRTTGVSIQAANDSTTSLTDPTILSLCRFLVELCFGAPLSRIRKAYGSHYELGRGEAAADRDMIETILSWASDETISPRDRPFYEEGRLYMDAVRNCLKCDFGQVKTSMTDPTFREGVYSRILCPLRWALEDFQAAQLQLFGATRESKAGREIEDRRLTGGVTLYDEDSDIDGTKYVLLSSYVSSRYEYMPQYISCGRVRSQYNVDSTAFICLQAELSIEKLRNASC